MELPVFVEPLPDRPGFTARLTAPWDSSAEAPTAEEACRAVAALLRQHLQQGAQVRSLNISAGGAVSANGWLPDDELTHDWRRLVEEYRAECDEADRLRLAGDSPEG